MEINHFVLPLPELQAKTPGFVSGEGLRSRLGEKWLHSEQSC